MKRLQIKSKKFVISLLSVVVLTAALTGTVYAYNSYNYNKQYELANKYLQEDKFDEAISTFTNSLRYKKSHANEIDNKITLANELKQSKTTFDDALKYMEQKKYVEAIELFNKVLDKDVNRYQSAQDNISNCKSMYINENMAAAKTEADKNNFDTAISYLDTVLNFEPSYEEAATLKEQYNKEIQRIKEEAARKAAEEKAAAAVASTASKTSQKTTTKVPEFNITISGPPPIEPHQHNLWDY